MSETVTETRPDTSDMVAVHRVFREALEAASDLVAEAVVEQPGKAEAVAGYYANVLAYLHTHHEGEEQLLWPLLRERCPDETVRVGLVAAQHDGVAQTLAQAERALSEWAAEPTAERGARLVGALGTLRFELVHHLDDEERDILPLAAEHLSAEEWARLPEYAMTHFSGDKVWLVLGLVIDAQADGHGAAMLEKLPQPMREFWDNEGRPQYDDFMAQLRA